MTYTHFILILRHSNRCDKMARCHPDARTREMLGSSGSAKAHAVHSHSRCPTCLRMGWKAPNCPELPPTHTHNFPLSLPGTGLYLSIETGLCCSLPYSFLCLPSSGITSTLLQSISRFFPLIISIFANNVLAQPFLYGSQQWFLTAPVEDGGPFFVFLLPRLLVCL